MAALNALYTHDLRLLQTLFLPSVKLVRKERVGARLRRRYDAPQTPLELVRACPEADPKALAQLEALRARLDPFALAASVDRQIERLLARATAPGRSTVTPTPVAVPTRPVPTPRRDFTFANHLRRPSRPRLSVTS